LGIGVGGWGMGLEACRPACFLCGRLSAPDFPPHLPPSLGASTCTTWLG
jgi:hypothetical protein